MSRLLAAAQEVVLQRAEADEDNAESDSPPEDSSAAEVASSPRSSSQSPRTPTVSTPKKKENSPGWQWSGKNNIMVCVRVRPMNRTELRLSNEVVRVMDDKMVVIIDPKTQDHTRSFLDPLRAARTREKRYAFDHVFNQSSPQQLVFNRTTRLLVPGVIDGYNATVFAYGATGAGKTFTMLGTPTNPGCMFNTLRFLFEQISDVERSESVKYTVKISMIEIYNELIKDLLEPSSENLDLREDPLKGPTVAGMAEIVAKSATEVMGLLHNGNKNRTQEATEANATSSRSHAILQVVVEQRDRNPGPQSSVKIGKLSMIDLAGSERASSTNNRGQRLIEGANINRSLLALGNCINALVMSKSNGFIPYRDSKLTRLLKDSLGGNCRTIMIANITPAASSFEETLNTLKYANRAKKIKTQATKNVLNVSYHVTQYLSLIAGLKREIQGLKSELVEARSSSSPQNRRSQDDALSQSVNDRESRELKSVRAEIVKGFHEGMELQKALVNLDSQLVQQKIDMRKLQLTVVQGTDQNVLHQDAQKRADASRQLQRRLSGASDDSEYSMDDFDETVRSPVRADGDTSRTYVRDVTSPGAVAQAREELARLEAQNKEVKEKRDQIAHKIKQIQHNNKSLKREVMSHLKSADRVELLEMEIRHGMLELQNMELEHAKMMQQNIIEEKDTLIERLRLQLEARDSVIKQQRAALESLGAHDRCQTAYRTLERLPTATQRRRKSTKSKSPAAAQSPYPALDASEFDIPTTLPPPPQLRKPLPLGNAHPLQQPHLHGARPDNHISPLAAHHGQLAYNGDRVGGFDPRFARGPPSRQRSRGGGVGDSGLEPRGRGSDFPFHQDEYSHSLDKTVVHDHSNDHYGRAAKDAGSRGTRSSVLGKNSAVKLSPLNINLPRRVGSPGQLRDSGRILQYDDNKLRLSGSQEKWEHNGRSPIPIRVVSNGISPRLMQQPAHRQKQQYIKQRSIAKNNFQNRTRSLPKLSKKNGHSKRLSYQEKIQRSTDRFRRQQRLRQQQSEAILKSKVTPKKLPALTTLGIGTRATFESQAARDYRAKRAKNRQRSSKKRYSNSFKKRRAGTKAIYGRRSQYRVT